MPGPPAPCTHRFHGLATVVDEVHDLFARWTQDGAFAGVLDEFGLYVVQLAVHEWVANLVQHAAFGGRPPFIRFTLSVEADGLRCEIEDNSDGFDFHRQIGRQETLVAEPVPSERGRGLLMMLACTEDLRYEPTDEGRQRLAFVVRPSLTPERLAPLFPTLGAFGSGDGDRVSRPAGPAP